MLSQILNILNKVYLFIKNKLLVLLCKIFTKSRISKILIIFIVGFTSRIFVNYMYNINIFLDFISYISLIYYFIFSMFIVLVHEVIDCLDVSHSVGPKFKASYISHMRPYRNNTPNASLASQIGGSNGNGNASSSNNGIGSNNSNSNYNL
jgi:hypothetical protein